MLFDKGAVHNFQLGRAVQPLSIFFSLLSEKSDKQKNQKTKLAVSYQTVKCEVRVPTGPRQWRFEENVLA